MTDDAADQALSIVRGAPMGDEPGIGALTLPAYLAEIARRFAEREAVVMHEGGEVLRWSYAELQARAMDVARALVAIGVSKDSRVGILMTNRPEWLSAMFGTAMVGAVSVMLNTFSTASELDDMLRSASVSVLLLEGHVLKKDFAAMLGELAPDIAHGRVGELRTTRYPYLRHLAVVGAAPEGSAIESWADFLQRGTTTLPSLVDAMARSVRPTDVASILFSSGSTARPKGIINAHRGICIQLWRFGRAFRLTQDVRAWTPNGFFWSGNFATVMGATLSVGGALILQQSFIPTESLALMEKERVNFPMVWPHQSKQLEEASNWRDVDLSAMYFVGSETPLARHPSVKPSPWQEARQSYGSTETFTITTGYDQGTPYEIGGDSHGKVLWGNVVKIVDPPTGKILPRGASGEIAVKGPTLMLGYLGLPGEESFDDEGFYRTGDGGFLDERGRLFFQGRLTTVIKTGGANVSPLEIDFVIEGFPGVKAVRSVGVPHETLGEMVVACIVPQEGAALDAAAIEAFTREKLASYKVPRRVLFLREDELALTNTSKIKPAELRTLAIAKIAAEQAATHV